MKNIFTIKTAQSDNLFHQQVNVEIYGHGHEYIEAISKKVNISYYIEVDYRSYGIKSIEVAGSGMVEIHASIENEVTSQIQQFVVIADCSKLKIDKTQGSGVYPISINIWLDQNRQVDYSNSNIEFICC